MSPPLVLAIHEDTNANASLVRGAEIVAAVAEERLSRTKFQPGYPARAVQAVLELAGVTLEQVDQIVAGNRFHFLPRVIGTEVIAGEHDLFGPTHKAWLTLQERCHRPGPMARGLEQVSRLALRRRFGRGVPLVDHHTAHAASAWFTSGFPEALAVTIDNMGDGASMRAFDCRGGRMRHLWSSSAIHSAGQFYGEITQLLGFRVLHAGKVTGLAARGDWRRAYPLMERLIRLNRDRTAFELAPLWRKSRRRGVFRELSGMSREDVSAAAQRRLEDLILQLVERALDETGQRHLVLAGGVFANVLVNQRLWGLDRVDGLFVHPAMNDQGISAGAALAWQANSGDLRPSPIPHVYLGPAPDEDAVGALLEARGLRYERCDDIDARVADLLVEGQVVARVSGAMEYGLRALGHRSILANPSDPGLGERLNRRLDRSDFMPFAPATIASLAERCYRDYGAGVAHAARFMTISLDTTEWMRAKAPAVVHVDGTARPQIVHEDAAPGYHRILSLFYERTGVPAVLNTSFNIHGEPIACSAEDALSIFARGGVDALALGPFLIRP